MRFLCVGDSLTAGYTYEQDCLVFRPYAAMLEDMGMSRFTAATVAESGLTLSEISQLLDEHLAYLKHNPGDVPDFVVILGGANDLGSLVHVDSAQWSQSVRHLTECVEGVAERVRDATASLRANKRPSTVVVVSVPPLGESCPGVDADGLRRASKLCCQFNEALRHTAENANAVFLDLHAAVAVANADGSMVLKPEYDSGDGLHLNPAGYRTLANLVHKLATATCVVCFGDSLTAGYMQNGEGINFAPYAPALQELSHGDLVCFHQGFPGDRTRRFLSKLRAFLSSVPIPPQVVVLLGGTNDLADADAEDPTSWHETALDVANRIDALVTEVFQIAPSVQTVAVLSVPPLGSRFEQMAFFPASQELRAILNQELRQRSESDSGRRRFIDINAVLANPDGAHSLRPEYDCGDSLHMSRAGYEAIAKCVYKALVKSPVVVAE